MYGDWKERKKSILTNLSEILEATSKTEKEGTLDALDELCKNIRKNVAEITVQVNTFDLTICQKDTCEMLANFWNECYEEALLSLPSYAEYERFFQLLEKRYTSQQDEGHILSLLNACVLDILKSRYPVPETSLVYEVDEKYQWKDNMNDDEIKVYLDYWYDRHEKEGFAEVYCTPLQDESPYDGKPFRVLGRIKPTSETEPEDAWHSDFDSLPMWMIEFQDGTQMKAYPEEIIPSVMMAELPFEKKVYLAKKLGGKNVRVQISSKR